MMIVDSHVYCFEPVDRPAGFASSEEHLRWVQASHAVHHQPAWRVRDRAPADSRVLAPAGRTDLSCLPDVSFRVDHACGRVVWTIDGEAYTKQFFPPNLRDLEFTPHGLIAEMDYAGVDMALLHTNPMLGRDSAYLADCVRLYPQRLRSMAPVDEWRIRSEMDAVIADLTTAIARRGLHAIKFNAPLASISGPEPWDDGPYRPFWEAATALRVPVFFTLGTGLEGDAKASLADQRQGYLDEQEILMRWMERYPDRVCSLTHGFPWRVFLDRDRITLPPAIWEPYRNPNCHLEVCFPVRLGDLFDFPCREVWPTLEQMVEKIGADRLLWGTDMPFQNRFCTYRQSRGWIENYCTFLNPDQRAQIMGGTAARILGL
jgi:predicted TIM-barrel fold metal-dependent hydrolase